MLKAILLASMFSDLGDFTPGEVIIIIFIGILIMLISLRISLKYARKYNKDYTYQRQVSSPYSRNTDRDDDIDIPSGFGGPSGYGVVRPQDLKPSDKTSTDGD
jgi:hypothetical protein